MCKVGKPPCACLGKGMFFTSSASTTIRPLMKKTPIGLSLLSGLGVLMAACGSSSGSSCSSGQVDCNGICIDAIEPTLASIQTQIFDRSCAASSCHDADLPAAMLDLSNAVDSGMNLVEINSVQIPSKLRVAPNDSSASYLMNKILGVDIAAGTDRMPQNDAGIVLCDPQIDAIRQWIENGAETVPES